MKPPQIREQEKRCYFSDGKVRVWVIPSKKDSVGISVMSQRVGHTKSHDKGCDKSHDKSHDKGCDKGHDKSHNKSHDKGCDKLSQVNVSERTSNV